MASLLSLRQISRKGKKREKKRERKRKERIVSRYTNLPLIIVSMIIFEMTASNSLSLSLSLSSFIPFHDAEGGFRLFQTV